MYKKRKYVILTLFLIGLSLFCYDYYQNFNGNYFFGISEFSLKVSAFLIVIITIYFSLPKEYKNEHNKLTIGIIGIILVFLFLNLNRSFIHYKDYRYEKVMTEYRNVGCDNMKEKFTSDLKNNELKYFSGGMFYNPTLAKNLKKYGIEDYYQGCIMFGELSCYSKLVAEYLEKEKDVDFKQLLE